MKLSIFGLGYVGCVSMGCLAQLGHTVIGVDTNSEKVAAINKGYSPIVEKGLSELINEQREKSKIEATGDFNFAVKNSDVSFICVGTPSTAEGHLNLTAIQRVAEEIAEVLKHKASFHTVAIRSTVFPGTCNEIAQLIEEKSGKRDSLDFSIISNPEFLREGSALYDYHNPPYTLIGGSNKQAIKMMKVIYENLGAEIIVVDVKIAEIMKYVNNAFHAQKVVFANEIGNICKSIGIDSIKVMEIFCRDTKLNLSPYYLKPGFAYGGSCLPKDLKALRTIAHDNYIECPLIESIERSNTNQIDRVFQQIMDIKKNQIGFLGLSFKADTDDLRNSPILEIIEKLLGKGVQVRIYDRNVHFSRLMGANKEYVLQKIPYISNFVTDDYEDVVNHSQAIVVVNKSDEFSDILSNLPEEKTILDLVDIDFDGKSERVNYIGTGW